MHGDVTKREPPEPGRAGEERHRAAQPCAPHGAAAISRTPAVCSGVPALHVPAGDNATRFGPDRGGPARSPPSLRGSCRRRAAVQVRGLSSICSMSSTTSSTCTGDRAAAVPPRWPSAVNATTSWRASSSGTTPSHTRALTLASRAAARAVPSRPRHEGRSPGRHRSGLSTIRLHYARRHGCPHGWAIDDLGGLAMELDELRSRLVGFCQSRYDDPGVSVDDVTVMPGHAGFAYGFAATSGGADRPLRSCDCHHPTCGGSARPTCSARSPRCRPSTARRCRTAGCDGTAVLTTPEWFDRPYFVAEQLQGGDVLMGGAHRSRWMLDLAADARGGDGTSSDGRADRHSSRRLAAPLPVPGRAGPSSRR